MAGVVLVHAALAAALLFGLAPRIPMVRDIALATFDVAPQSAPPPAPEPISAQAPEPTGEAAPPARRADPKPVAAPKPIIPPPHPLPSPPRSAEGNAVMAGAAPLPGPGTGAAGVGDGLGSGNSGAGTGGGGSSARLVRGAIVNRDYPRDARRAKLGGDVTIGFTVQPDGRATGCTVIRSSGVASLDATTCKLVEKRFRYDPARDAAGRPVAEQRGWRQRWWIEGATSPLD